MQAVTINPDFAVSNPEPILRFAQDGGIGLGHNPPRPLGLGLLIKPLRGLITTAEVIPDFFLHNLVRSVIDLSLSNHTSPLRCVVSIGQKKVNNDDFAAPIEKSGINRKM